EGRLEFLVAQLEGVVVLVDMVVVIEIQADAVGQGDRSEARERRVDVQAEDVGEELRRCLRVVRGYDGVIQFDAHCRSSRLAAHAGVGAGGENGNSTRMAPLPASEMNTASA